MKIIEYQWQSSNKQVYGVIFQPETEARAVIVFIHGIGEHSRRYDSWFKKFCDLGIAVVTGDHHGHGRSEGKRGHFKSYCEPLDFTTMLFEKADELFPHLPKILYGHSMGGNISLNYLLRKQPKVKAALISAPWIKLLNPPSKFLRGMSRIMQMIYPSFTNHTGIKREQLTKNEEELERFKKDELVHGRVSVNTYLEFDAAAKYVQQHIQNINIPMLLMHGGADPISDPEGSAMLHRKNQKLIEFKVYDGFLHEIHKEPNRDLAFKDIEQFLSKAL